MTHRSTEDVSEDQEEDGVDEEYDCNRDVEGVCLLVHPWPQNADGD